MPRVEAKITVQAITQIKQSMNHEITPSTMKKSVTNPQKIFFSKCPDLNHIATHKLSARTNQSINQSTNLSVNICVLYVSRHFVDVRGLAVTTISHQEIDKHSRI